MSNSSILGGERAARQAIGRDVDALGPSDSSDSGSDIQGERAMSTDADNPAELGGLPVAGDSDSDSMGTGERGSAVGADGRDGADISPDHIESASEEMDLLDTGTVADTDIDTLATDEEEDDSAEDDDEV